MVILWAGLNFLDDLSIAMRLARLAAIASPFRDVEKSEMCDLCDDVMHDILMMDGVNVLPCSLLCLKLPACMDMCESVKEVSGTSSKYPCVAAGYCSATEEGYADTDSVECEVGAFFACKPKHFCHRKRRGIHFSCELRPGLGRWVGIKNSIGAHAGAVFAGLTKQPHCGEEGAGPYCLAKPTGFGAIAEIAGYVLSLVWGGYQSILAIESPGGDDDQQWLTFWLILGFTLFLERFLARVLLSTFSMYYELKFAVIIWLQFFGGAESVYRKLRRFCISRKLLSPDDQAKMELKILEQTGKAFIRQELDKIRRQSITAHQRSLELSRADGDDVDYELDTGDEMFDPRSYEVKATEKTQKLCAYLLSKEGIDKVQRSNILSDGEKEDLLERAYTYFTFEPRYLYATIIGVQNSPEGELPPMDSNGFVDGYVICKIVGTTNNGEIDDTVKKQPWYRRRNQQPKTTEISSRTIYKNLRPQWNEQLELPLSGGYIGTDGTYHNHSAKNSCLCIEVWDADVGLWSFILRVLPFLNTILMVAIVISYILGVSDTFTKRQVDNIQATFSITLIVFAISYIMAVIFRADDDFIGKCTVPLSLLMDRGEHPLLLTLRDENPKLPQQATTDIVSSSSSKSKKKKNKKKKNNASPNDVAATSRITNSVGSLGILRVRLLLSDS